MRSRVLLFIFLSGILRMHAQNILDNLPDISGQTIYMQQANYDRAGLNADGFVSKTIFDTIPHGQVNNPGGTTDGTFEYVLADITGPAVLQRFWFALTEPIGTFRFYFDGEVTPRLEKSVTDMFYAQQAPFTYPLVENLVTSSGCYVMYFPMNIAQNLVITFDSNFIFHQTGYTKLKPDTAITSWSFSEDNSDLASLFYAAGIYPKSNAGTLQHDSLVFSLAPLETRTVFTQNTGGSIESINMILPSLNFNYSERIFDKGNYRKGIATFKVKIDKTADSVVLINRMNKNPFFKAQPQANSLVFVNGNLAGIWSVEGFRDHHFWDNERYKLPRNLYLNKDSITISIQYLNGRNWNEFYYWVECDGSITDSVDVRDSASETAHQFMASGIVYDPNQEIRARYLSPPAVQQANQAILDSVWIRIYFDDEVIPSVDAPIGLFFGTGSRDAAYMSSFLCGNVDGQYYNYFTMPFRENARVELENKSASALPGIVFKTSYVNGASDMENSGYFKTYYRKETKYSNDKTDYHFLSADGKGKFCGIVIEGNMNNVPVGPVAWLEGDERIYTDDARTPFIHGTGTEDFFNGGFYFVFDEYSKAQHGMTNSGKNYHRSMYRFLLTDPIYFYKNIRAGIEHGGANDTLGNYTSLAFYYCKPDTTYQLTDSIDVGNATSEQKHRYQYTGTSWTIDKNSTFEGEKFMEIFHEDGYAFDDYSEFMVYIRKNNNGVRLLRTCDYSYKNQRAWVYVNDTLIGTWSYVGNNTISQFRDDNFMIPASMTRGRDSLNIKLVNQDSIWTELYYKVFTIVDPKVIPTSLAPLSASNGTTVFPNPASRELFVRFKNDPGSATFQVFNTSGQHQRTQAITGTETRVALNGLPAGVYFYEIRTEKFFQTGKFIKTPE